MLDYIGFIGIALLLATAYAWSENRKAIKWRMPAVGLLASAIVGLLVLKVPGTSDAVMWIVAGVNQLSHYALKGANFVLGHTLSTGDFQRDGSSANEFIFAIVIGCTIIFVCGLVSLGYHCGILQRIVQGMGFVLRRTLGLTGAESLSCAASCWVGQVEAQLLIKPYMPNLTRSELFTSMTNSMATASGGALLLYMSLGISGKLLIAASLMSSLNAIVLTKIIIPETDYARIQQNVELVVERSSSFFDAMEKGVMHGLRIAVAVVVMVMFAIAFMEMCNGILSGALNVFGFKAEIQDIIGFPFRPVSFLIGVPWSDAALSGRWIATEGLFNEVVSYSEMMRAVGANLVSERTIAIMSVALCGFAHPGSIGILIGGLGQMAPDRRSEISKMALKSMVVANMATWISAAQVGIIYSVLG